MDHIFAELKRRHIYRVAAAYVVVAWVVVQVVNNLTPMLRLPEWIGPGVVVLLLVGLPLALLFAWIRELPTSGVGVPQTRTTGFDYALLAALITVIVLVSYTQFAPRPEGPVQQASLPAPAPAQPADLAIAVLPFANLSGDAAQEYFSDGMTEEITGALAKVPNLHVVARTSAFQFKGQNRDI